MKRSHFSFAVLAIILSWNLASAQVSTGTAPFGSFGGGPFDVVNLGNLNVHFSIPIFHKAGRGVPFSYDLSYDGSIWYAVTVNGQLKWQPTANWGWTSKSLAVLGYLPTQTTITQKPIKCSTGFGVLETDTTTYAYVDSRGMSHPFPGSTYQQNNSCTNGWSNGPTLTSTTTDGSGYTLKAPANLSGDTVTTRSGILVYTNIGSGGGSGTYQDTNGNQLTVNNSTGQFFDTLSGSTAVLTQAGSGTPSSPITYTYTAPSTGNAVYTVKYTSYTVKTNFGFSTIGEYGPIANNLVSEIDLPDGSKYTFQYEATPGYSGDVTGRLASVTLPTGGTITYTYSGGTNGTGIYSDGSTAGLNRILAASATCNSSNGCWQYSRSLVSGTPAPGSTWQTTVIDPNSNYTVVNFAEDGATGQLATYNFYETQRQAYQGSVSPSNLLATTIKCYNNNYATCASATVSSPITQTDFYSQLPNGSTRLSETLYNGYGLVTDDKEYDYGVPVGSAPGTAHLVRESTTTYASLGNGIVNRPASVVGYDWTSGTRTTLVSTTYTYDGSTAIATSGTPQHVSVAGSRGNLTTIATQASSTATLYRQFTYYDTGMPNNATGVDTSSSTTCSSKPSICTTYNYSNTTASCGNSFTTSVTEPLGLSRSMVWNCTGGLATQVTDENGFNLTSNYTDPNFWRPASITDQMGNQTNTTYIGRTASEAALQNLNGGNSVSDGRTAVDGFGRPILSQRLQGPGATSYDTVETDYNNVGLPYRATLAFSAPAGGTNSTAPATTKTYDALGRVVTSQDADGGTVSFTYTNNDVLQKVSGTQTFQKQFEYDGLGRLTSVCELSQDPGSGTCGQSNQVNGFWTKYTYDALGNLLTVMQNAQGSPTQTRSFTYDMLGRTLSESNPETGHNGVNGTTTYTYDYVSPCGDGNTYSYPGNLVQKKDNAGNITCYAYDALHRVVQEGNSSISGATIRKFFYDHESSYPSGVTVSNGNSHMIEAQTLTTSNSVITDDFFSYSARGELTDVYESTPHSSGFYHTSASYWSTGTLKSLSGIPGVPTIYYGASNGSGLDPEGRVTQVTAASGPNPVTSVTYSSTSSPNILGAVTNVTFGSQDNDSFTYDSNTGRMLTYSFAVNGKADAGTLTWNSNGTLGSSLINNQIPGTSDSQSCSYSYDSLRRVSSASCGGLWSQTFTYDAFGNITKSGTASFMPGYTFGNNAITNQFFSLPGATPQYDADGNLLTDNLNTYTWDPNWGTMLSASSPSTTVNATYDALGRVVEKLQSGTYTEVIYGPTGVKLATVNGQTLIKAFIALPGGAKAIYTSSGLTYYRHSDWLGSSRLTSTQSRTLYSSSAYAPYGEQYATAGSSDASFTGMDQDTLATLYDFPARRYSPSQGRWVSPDPLGRGAVTLTNPQSWNRYAYVSSNPLSLTDPVGLQEEGPVCWNCGGGGYVVDPSVDGCATMDASCGTGNLGNSGSLTDFAGGGPIPIPDCPDQSADCTPGANTDDCIFISAGINTSPTNSGGMKLEDFADKYPGSGMDLAMPYGSGVFSGALSVFSQALFGPDNATRNFANSLASVTSTNSNVTLVLFSGSAQAFNTALSNGMVSQSELNSISQIIYLSPGSPGGFGAPQYSDGSPIPTAVYNGQGFKDNVVTGINVNGMPSSTAIDNCGHDLVCELGAQTASNGPVISQLPAESNCTDSSSAQPAATGN